MATIESLLRDHVTLQVRSVDRIFLQGYVPRLMTQGLLIRFLLDRGNPILSPALLGRIGRDYVAAIERYAAENEIPMVRFAKGASKEEAAKPHLERAEREGRTGCVTIGVAQEKTSAWRGWREGGPDGHPHFEVRPPDRLRQSLLLLPPRPRLGPGLPQDLRLRALPGLDLSQRARVGQAPGRRAGRRLRAPRQRLSLHRRRRGAGGNHLLALSPRGRSVLSPLVRALALAPLGR